MLDLVHVNIRLTLHPVDIEINHGQEVIQCVMQGLQLITNTIILQQSILKIIYRFQKPLLPLLHYYMVSNLSIWLLRLETSVVSARMLQLLLLLLLLLLEKQRANHGVLKDNLDQDLITKTGSSKNSAQQIHVALQHSSSESFTCKHYIHNIPTQSQKLLPAKHLRSYKCIYVQNLNAHYTHCNEQTVKPGFTLYRYICK